jgi:hypothetical protein
MLEKLYRAEQELPRILKDQVQWQGMRIRYHKPFVDRLWCTWEDVRIYMHKIYTCLDTEALVHTHPWRSAMRVVEGTYEMGVGSGAILEKEQCAVRLHLPKGSSYEMTEPNGWHYVRPLTDTTLSLMITDTPWIKTVPVFKYEHVPLSDSERLELFRSFLKHYA